MQRYQITESKPVGKDQRICTIFIEDRAALDEIPVAISDTFAIGSVAYTPQFNVYFFTTDGWVVS